MPKADSKNKNIRQIRQPIPVIGLYEFTIIKKINMIEASPIPIIQANLFCFAPTYSGIWFLTIKRPMINEGAYLGLIKMRISRSVKNSVIKYFAGTKLLLDNIITNEINVPKNNMPADALISRSLSTGML